MVYVANYEGEDLGYIALDFASVIFLTMASFAFIIALIILIRYIKRRKIL